MKKKLSDPRMPKTHPEYQDIRKDIIFAMAYLKLPQPFSVYVGHVHTTYVMQFSYKKKLLWESYFQHDLETTLQRTLHRKQHE
jgi:hypothetical protein